MVGKRHYEGLGARNILIHGTLDFVSHLESYPISYEPNNWQNCRSPTSAWRCRDIERSGIVCCRIFGLGFILCTVFSTVRRPVAPNRGKPIGLYETGRQNVVNSLAEASRLVILKDCGLV